jgi:polysaccharide deacetylase family protein (PEP-CTERM system associated)
MQSALTFDVEESFHAKALTGCAQPSDWTRLPSRVVASTVALLDLLDRHRVSATFFGLRWIAERHPALVRAIHARGHEGACHGYAHRLIYTMDRRSFQDDSRRAKSTIEDVIGAPILGYRPPTFSVIQETRWALEVLATEGVRYDSSIFPIHHDRYGIPGGQRFPHRVPRAAGGALVEFPLTTVRLAGQRLPVSGGGYLRLVRLFRAALGFVNKREAGPAIVYLHPWELDPDHPRLPVTGFSRFRHYVNLRHTARKLTRLLTDFSFAPASAVLRHAGFAEVTL